MEDRALRSDGIDTVYARSGQRLEGDDVADDVIGIIFLEFADWSARRPSSEILREIRARTTELAGILVETREPKAGPPTSSAEIIMMLKIRK